MAAAYRVVVSSVSCYNSVVVDRRTHSHAVHYCSGPCGALSQGIDCSVAHHGTCSELLIAPDSVYIDPNSSLIHSHRVINQQLSNNGKIFLNMDTSYNGGLEQTGNSGNLSLGEDSPTWRGKKNPCVGGSTGNLSSSCSLKDITEEAINLASGKLKEFSFDKLRHSSSSHVTFRKGRKVRPDSFTRRSTDLEIIYGHFSSHITTNGNAVGMANEVTIPNDENLPRFVPGKGTGLEETKLKGNTGSLPTSPKLGSGSITSLSSIGSLDQSLNTVASLYLNTLGEENLISRLLEKTRAEAGTEGTGGEDIRACLDILLKCSEDLKKCTDIIKQCIRHKAGGRPDEGGASPDSIYRAVMSRLSSYLKRLPLELDGIGSLGGSVQGLLGSGQNDLAELVSTLHSIQHGPYSPIFGNEQPPRYEDVVRSPPLPKTVPPSTSSTFSSLLSSSSFSKSDSVHNSPLQSSPTRTAPLTNGLQHQHLYVTQHTHCPPSKCSPTHSPAPLCTSPTPPYTHTPPASPVEALYIEEEEADVDKASDQVSQQTFSSTSGVNPTQNTNGTTIGQHMLLSHPHTLYNSSNNLQANTPTWPSSDPKATLVPKAVLHRTDDIDKLLMDLENLSQSMSHPRNTEPPLPAKTRKREGGQRITSSEALTQPKLSQIQVQKPAGQLVSNSPSCRTPTQNLTHPKGENSEAVVEEEEDGALLLRILESIESFAQELVDSGAGSTGSAEKSSGKEREVMRLLQDTLANTGRVNTPLEGQHSPAPPNTSSMQSTTVPAIPPKQLHGRKSAVFPSPSPISAVPETVYSTSNESATDEAPKSLPIHIMHIAEPTAEATHEDPRVTDTKSSPAFATSVPASLHSSTHLPEPTPEAAPEASAPVAVSVVAAKEDTAVPALDSVPERNTGSTLLIQQTPEVIRVQSKPEKKPGTPPPAPTLAIASPSPTPCSPSPAPAPVIITPPPPAINIPRFYYPRGLPAMGQIANHDAAIAAIETAFKEFEEEKADIYEMGKIAKACGCPLYWKAPMFYSAGGERTGFVSVHSFVATWRKLLHSCHDDASRFIYLLAKPSCYYLEQEDFIPLLQDIVDTHPGLTFLKDAPEFHSRYITTVIQRIFYVVNRSWTGRITMMELRRSNFLQTLALLEEEDDINQITDYFSYEHFYVIYCKFWELDTDHDLYIDPKDLSRYNDHASSNRIIERLFSGAVTRGNAVQREGRMSYAEFVWFLISEEDKKNPTSIEYWFRCMDIDGDGFLSMYELEHFYEEQCERMERMGIEPLPFQDLLCQMLDLVKPENQGKITLGDLKRCRMAHIFFDTFFNLEKYLDHEQRDPFALQKDVDSEGPEPSDWDKYASEEYEILVAEETANEQLHEGSFDEDYESEELQVPADKPDSHKRTLTINPLKRSDAGEYTCDVNTDQIHFSLLVKEMRIRFVRPLQDIVAHANGMVTLHCEVCKPKADVQWLRNGVELVPSRRFSIRADGPERSLTIHRLTREDTGQYTCESKDDRTVATLRVEMPRVVEFLTELHNTTVLEGEDATFKCVVSPDDVQLVWFMDNEPITLCDRFQATQNGLCHTLVIKKCQMLDCSKITAEAEGQISKASLKVQEAQVMFTKKMEAVMAEEFGDATLETEISLEMGEVQWMRQGVVIQPGPRHTLTQNGCRRSLSIHNLTLSDRGTYRCETLHDRTQVKLNVEPRKISIRKGLTEQETFERETASFEVELSHADVEGIWQKDGIRVKPNNQWRVSTNGRVHGLTVSNLTLEDTGTIVFSAEGARTTARLTVKETPVSILKTLSDVRVEEDFPATLECEFSRQIVEVRWFKNGKELKAGKNCRIYSMGRKRFCQIMQCSQADSGTYTCDTGEINTSCLLEVYEHKLEIVQDLEDLYIQEDQNAVFMCEVSLEEVAGEWYKDGHKIRPTSTIKIRTEGTKHFLLMCNVNAEDAGEIRFVARDVESIAYLEVEELPVSIVKPLRDRTALEKHRVILECTVSSPRCSASWYKDGEELVPSDRVNILDDGCSLKLLIQQVAVEDEGTYCVKVGEHKSKAKLMVEAQALVVVQHLEDVEVSEPEPASFQCQVSVDIHKPPVWTLNGETLLPGPSVRLENHGTTHKLILKDTSADMSGLVKFTMGKAKSSAVLTVT